MNIYQSLTLLITGFIALIFVLLLIQVSNAKNKITNDDGKIKVSFALWNGSLFIGGAIIIAKMLSLIHEAITIYTNASTDFMSIIKSTSIFLGLSSLWIVCIFYINKLFVLFLISKKDEKIELQNDHWEFYLIKSILFVGSIIGLLPAFDDFLRIFMPSINVGIYH